MSHNTLTVADQKPSLDGLIDLGSTNLGGFASANNTEYFGIDGAGDPKNVTISASTGFTPVYGMQIRGTGWGGSSTYSVGSYLSFRRNSAPDEYINSSYCAVGFFGQAPSYTTWGNYVELQPGKYFLNWNTGFAPSSASDFADIRLKNMDSGTYEGPFFRRGEGRNMGAYYVICDVTSAAKYAFEITAKSGTITIVTAAEQRYYSISILRF